MLNQLKDRASRLLQNPDVQRAVAWAEQTSRRVRENLAEARRNLAEALSVEGNDDLEPLKRELDRLTAAQQGDDTGSIDSKPG